MYRHGFTFAVPLIDFSPPVDNCYLVFKIPLNHDKLPETFFHFFIIFCHIHAKQPVSRCDRSSIFIFIENISMNFNQFYGIIANKNKYHGKTQKCSKSAFICYHFLRVLCKNLRHFALKVIFSYLYTCHKINHFKSKIC